jgi:hypothetical protein
LTHLAEGVLRRYLDEPAAVGDAERTHLSTCPRCREELERAGRDRDEVARLIAGGDGHGHGATAPDLDEAWAALCRSLDRPASAGRDRVGIEPVETALAGIRRRPRLVERAARRPVTAAVAVGLVVLGGTAAAAAADWLPGFRTEKVAPVTVSAPDLADVDQLLGQAGQLAELSAYGDVVGPTDVRPVPVADAGAAAARTGLTVPRVAALPTGVEGTPGYYVVDHQQVDFTFSAVAAARTAQTHGITLPAMPAGLDGTRLRVEGGPAVAQVWAQRSGVPTLIVLRAKAPTAATRGASLVTVRDYLLSLPGISAQLAAQLRAVTGDGTTLPIPVPASLATSSQADVGGVPATVVQTRDRAAVGVIWVEHGELDAVLGPLSRDEVLGVARGLR